MILAVLALVEELVLEAGLAFNIFMIVLETKPGFMYMATLLVLGIVFSTIAVSLLSASNDTVRQLQTLDRTLTSYTRSASCAQYGVYSLAQNDTYSGDEDIAVGTGTCSVLPVNVHADPNIPLYLDRTVCAYAEDGDSSRMIEVKIDTLSGSVVITSWQEVFTTPAACT